MNRVQIQSVLIIRIPRQSKAEDFVYLVYCKKHDEIDSLGFVVSLFLLEFVSVNSRV